MLRGVRMLALACSLLATGCIEFVPYESGANVGAITLPPPPPSAGGANARDNGDLVVVWPEPAPAGYQSLQDALRRDGQFDTWIGALNARLALPRDIPLRYESCDVENAYYDPEAKEVVLCYELLDRVARVMSDPSRSEESNSFAIGSAWLFVVLHETGHALIDAYGLPITGREEDAADDLATLTLIHMGATDAAIDSAAFWAASDPGSYSSSAYADEHSLDAQRFYAILCTVYGSDSDGNAWLVDEGYLPQERAVRCSAEFARKEASWEQLLEPWTKT